MNLSEIQKLVYEECEKNGYVKMWNEHGKVGDIAELGLIPTEVAEAQEEIRNKQTDFTHLGIECADIIIRTLNFMSRHNLNAEAFIIAKHKTNMERKALHDRDV